MATRFGDRKLRMASNREWWQLFAEIHDRITTTQAMVAKLGEQAVQLMTGRRTVGGRDPRLAASNIIGCLCGAQVLARHLGKVVKKPTGPRPRKSR